jgi:cell division control protein 6
MFESFQSRIIKDSSKLSFDYVPEKLVHRDEQMRRLFSLFRPVLDGVSANAFLVGSVGTGKTALSKRFCLDFKAHCAAKGKAMDSVLVNCRQRGTDSAALLRIVQHFQPHFPDRGFSTAEMLDILRKDLDKAGVHLIVILDEVDVLLKKSGSDLVYSLARFDDERAVPKGRISIIMISQKWALDLLDPAALSTFKRGNAVELGKYNAAELADIVRERARLALHPGAVDDDAMMLIGDIASEWGDARFAIELLEKAGMLAEDSGAELVVAEHVRAAKAETNPVVTEDKLAELDTGKALALLGVARSLRKATYASTGEIEKNYAVACEEFGEKPRAHTQFWGYLKELDSLGFIEAKVSGTGSAGRTTMVSLPDVPAKALEGRLVDILANKRGKK